MSTCAIAGTVVNSHAGDGQSLGVIDTDGLDGCVFNIQVRDRRRSEIMSRKELGLRLATVGSLAIPPTGAVWIQNGTTGTLDSDIIALNLEQGARPLLVAPSSCTLKDDLYI